MQKYPKIQTLFKRCTEKGPDKNKLINGDWTLPEFQLLQSVKWDASEKLDGTNISVIWDGEKVEFAGRDENAQIPAKLVNHLIGIFTIDTLKNLDLPPMIIYGEGVGAGIQKAGKGYVADGVDFAPFDVFSGGLWLYQTSVEDISQRLGLHPAPYLQPRTLHQAIDTAKSGRTSEFPGSNVQSEGLVLRAPEGLLTRRGERLICKIKTRDFAKGTIGEPSR